MVFFWRDNCFGWTILALFGLIKRFNVLHFFHIRTSLECNFMDLVLFRSFIRFYPGLVLFFNLFNETFVYRLFMPFHRTVFLSNAGWLWQIQQRGREKFRTRSYFWWILSKHKAIRFKINRYSSPSGVWGSSIVLYKMSWKGRILFYFWFRSWIGYCFRNLKRRYFWYFSNLYFRNDFGTNAIKFHFINLLVDIWNWFL